MTDERRYDDDEMREIFAAASESRTPEPGGRALPGSRGLTLRELQEIGEEAGIPPERVSEAARAMDTRPATAPSRTRLGVPVSVARTVQLPRAPTDAEWDRLVTELRATFDAGGRVETHGGIREWRNGNLFASVEPSDLGYRLRMGTRKGNADYRIRMGFGAILLAVVIAVMLALEPGASVRSVIFGPLIIGGFGGASVLSVLMGQPKWARLREQQMEHIAQRARELIGPGEG